VITSTQLRVGMLVLYNGKPHRVATVMHRTPGNLHKLQFSYKSADTYHFMNTESYEMIELSGEILGDNAGYLIDGMMITAEYFQGRVVGIQPPMFVELAVKETTPNIKGAAVQNTSKPAILETGLEIKVPPYIEEGDKVRLDTRTGEFVERV
jgi:elongation factor P